MEMTSPHEHPLESQVRTDAGRKRPWHEPLVEKLPFELTASGVGSLNDGGSPTSQA